MSDINNKNDKKIIYFNSIEESIFILILEGVILLIAFLLIMIFDRYVLSSIYTFIICYGGLAVGWFTYLIYWTFYLGSKLFKGEVIFRDSNNDMMRF